MEARMPLSETACEILGFFRETHRKPGAHDNGNTGCALQDRSRCCRGHF